MPHIYLDHSATTPLAPEVLEAMLPHLAGTFGNASSIHFHGRRAKQVLEEGRETIARSIGAAADELFFTSGGTEADNYALIGTARGALGRGKKHFIISAVEHHAVLAAAEQLEALGCERTILPVDGNGSVDPDEVRRALRPDTFLISVMHANNEVGTIQPLEEIAELARENGVVVHSDAVQTLGKLPIDVRALPVDLLSFSAHKLYGPKGIGALYIRKGTLIESFIVGGSQESKRRAGTENVPGVAGFARAVELASSVRTREWDRLLALKRLLRSELANAFPAVLFNGHPDRSLSHILNISFDAAKASIDGDALIMGMDLRGVAVTSGSACTSGSLQPSHVLKAMGRDDVTTQATIRFSMGRSTTEEEIRFAVSALRETISAMPAAR